MIIGIGIDLVDIQRFLQWHTKSIKSLTRIFSQEEIDYCLQIPMLSAERFAVRFAAKEAFFKAIQTILLWKIPFLTLCKYSWVLHENSGKPMLKIDKARFINYISPDLLDALIIHLSLSHSREGAIAMIIIERK